VGTQGTSASKRQLDIDKRQRAAAKRDRRQRRRAEAEGDAPDQRPDGARVANDDDSRVILEQMDQLQSEFKAHVIDFETYEARKTELLGRLQV